MSSLMCSIRHSLPIMNSKHIDQQAIMDVNCLQLVNCMSSSYKIHTARKLLSYVVRDDTIGVESPLWMNVGWEGTEWNWQTRSMESLPQRSYKQESCPKSQKAYDYWVTDTLNSGPCMFGFHRPRINNVKSVGESSAQSLFVHAKLFVYFPLLPMRKNLTMKQIHI